MNAPIFPPGLMPRLMPRAAALLAVGLGVAGFAQEATRPAGGPLDPADAALDRLLNDPATRAAAGRVLDADSGAGALDSASGGGPLAVAPDTPPQRLLREGTFVVDRVGRAVVDDAGAATFVFAADTARGAAAGDPPMRLVPNLNLQALESALGSDPARRFRVTGRVTEYRGRNHLILDKVVVLD